VNNAVLALTTRVVFGVTAILFAAQSTAAQSFEVGLVDQSNSAGTTLGGTIHIFDGAKLSGTDVPNSPIGTIDLGGATTTMCVADPHVSTGTTPGVMMIKIEDGGRLGQVMGIVRVSNVGADGIDRANPHGIRVRRR
jgi:hypothetical protein